MRTTSRSRRENTRTDAALLVALAVLMTAQAAAATTCADPRLEVRGELAPHWLGPVLELCDALGTFSDVDPSARLRIVPEGQEVIVEVRLTDGRNTLRRVRSPADLRMTVEALLTVPPTTPEPTPEPKAPPAPAPIALEMPPEALPPTHGSAPDNNFEVESGAMISGRVAGSPGLASVGPAGHASLRVGNWLFGLSARWDAYQKPIKPADRSFEMDSIAAGLGIGRRFVVDPSLRVDLGVALLLLNEAQSTESTDGEQAGSIADMRVGTGIRLWLGSSKVRFLSQLDGELSPTRLRRDIRIDPTLPPLPTWSVGLGLGIGWAGP